MFTVIPDHHFILGISGRFTSSHNSKNISLVNHLYNTYAWSKLTINDGIYFLVKLEYLETFLRTDRKVCLILVKTDVDYLLFFLLHLIIIIINHQHFGTKNKSKLIIAIFLIFWAYSKSF